ncbi:Bromodomain-containing protein [Phycomyces blakesleeanus]|uniref:Bromodomain-containing protein n=1 Tax=Phycomyces blakesleeanus TaxID=4837 RepID=A0ABR3ALT6_PHYBL
MANGYSMDHPPAATETPLSLDAGRRKVKNDDDDEEEKQEEKPTNLKKRPKLEHVKNNTTNLSKIAIETNMTKDQIKYCGAIIRHLKKHRDAAPFLHPVDYISLNVPDYPKIVKHPMDLNTVDRKLSGQEYTDVEDMIADIRLVFSNCYKFNGPEAMISMLCQNVESAFEKSLRQMPPSKREVTSPTPPRQHSMSDKVHRKKKIQPSSSPPLPLPSTPRYHSPPVSTSNANSNANHSNSNSNQNSNSVSNSASASVAAASAAAARRASEDGRPKREIHPPPSKDYPETITKRRTMMMNPRKNDVETKFCSQTLRELKKSKYRDINFPFLAPVDIVALNIPDYPSIVKNPMDLSTIESKLAEGFYDSPEAFEADIRLMFKNCYLYNPPAVPVHRMGRELEKVFDEKWKQKPVPVQETFEEFEPVESDEDATTAAATTTRTTTNFVIGIGIVIVIGIGFSVDRRDHRISELERHIASLAQQIASIKSKKKRPERPQKPVRPRPMSPKDKKPFSKRHRLSLKTKEEELPEFTFEQKKDLSERINNLTGDRLNTVVNIIQSSMPNLDGQGQEEIVLDIDALDRKTLHRLHEFVTGRSLIPPSSLLSSSPSPSLGSHKKSAPNINNNNSSHNNNNNNNSHNNNPSKLENTLQKFTGSKPDTFYGQESSSESDSDSSSGSDSDDSGSSSD